MRALAFAAVGLIALVGCGSSSAPDVTTRPSAPLPVAVNSARIPVRVLGTNGPTTPAGPFAGTSIRAIRVAAQDANHGNPVICRPDPCWAGVAAPPGTLLVSFRATLTACFPVISTRARLDGRVLTVDVRTTQACSGGGGQAALAQSTLVAIPLRDLPRQVRLWVLVRATVPPYPASVIGRTSVTL